jgi:hypothetical protein
MRSFAFERPFACQQKKISKLFGQHYYLARCAIPFKINCNNFEERERERALIFLSDSIAFSLC